jgi:hypothetical protein
LRYLSDDLKWKFAVKNSGAAMRDLKTTCPKCGQSDAIRKVNSIVDEGTTYTKFNQVGMSIAGDRTGFSTALGDTASQTDLASALASPSKPRAPFRRGFPGLRSTCVVWILGLMIATFVCGFIFLYPTYRDRPLLNFIPIIIFITVASVLGRWLWTSNRRETKEFRQAQEQYPLELAQWERAMARWEQLYYCSRDHGVFLPNHSQLTDVKNMQVLLYAQDKRKR